MRTVEHRTDESSGKICFLERVQSVWDLWSIRIIRPRLLLRVGHGLDVYDGFRWRAESKGWRGGFRDGEKTLKLDGQEVTEL